jgi:hypothetical protein
MLTENAKQYIFEDINMVKKSVLAGIPDADKIYSDSVYGMST